MVASVPDTIIDMPGRILRARATKLVDMPVSVAMTARSGMCCENSQKKSSGLSGSASMWARRSSSCHQAATFFSIVARHFRSGLACSSGRSAASVFPASPTRLTSIG